MRGCWSTNIRIVRVSSTSWYAPFPSFCRQRSLRRSHAGHLRFRSQRPTCRLEWSGARPFWGSRHTGRSAAVEKCRHRGFRPWLLHARDELHAGRENRPAAGGPRGALDPLDGSQNDHPKQLLACQSRSRFGSDHRRPARHAKALWMVVELRSSAVDFPSGAELVRHEGRVPLHFSTAGDLGVPATYDEHGIPVCKWVDCDQTESNYVSLRPR